MLKIITTQPRYYAGEHPDATIADFLLGMLRSIPSDSLIVLPEYSNAGGLSSQEAVLRALSRADDMKKAASLVAAEKHAYVAVNVLEKRDDLLWNSTYLYGRDGKATFVYDKIHLPPSEIQMNIQHGNGLCVCEADGLRFAFMTCYDVYYNEQIEYIASQKPDIILVPGYQRGERTDIIRAQAKLLAFRCNAYLVRSSYSMDDDLHGGCSMIVAPDGSVLCDLGKDAGVKSVEIDPLWKYMRSAGFGGDLVRNDDFINAGLRPVVFG